MDDRNYDVDDELEHLKTFEFLDGPEETRTQSLEIRADHTPQEMRSSIPVDVSGTGSLDVQALELTQFGKLLQALKIPFLLINPNKDERIEFVSSRWERVCPGTADNERQSFTTIIPDKQARKDVQRLIQDIVITRRPSSFETAVAGREGKIWGRMDFLSVKLTGARYVLVTLQDMTFERELFDRSDDSPHGLESEERDRAEQLAELESELQAEKEKTAREQALRKAAELRLSEVKTDFDHAWRRVSLDTSRALATFCQERDKTIALHHERVTLLAGMIADRMRLDNETRRSVQLAAALHDIGKLMLTDASRRGPQNSEDFDWEVIKRHPEFGYSFLKSLTLPDNVTQAVLQHHEMLDGSGYPGGLSGGDICLEARIIRVADTAEAMLTGRPWRPEKVSTDTVILELVSGSRKNMYDIRAVNACAAILREGFSFED